jgi:hypothetical protein
MIDRKLRTIIAEQVPCIAPYQLDIIVEIITTALLRRKNFKTAAQNTAILRRNEDCQMEDRAKTGGQEDSTEQRQTAQPRLVQQEGQRRTGEEKDAASWTPSEGNERTPPMRVLEETLACCFLTMPAQVSLETSRILRTLRANNKGQRRTTGRPVERRNENVAQTEKRERTGGGLKDAMNGKGRAA